MIDVMKYKIGVWLKANSKNSVECHALEETLRRIQRKIENELGGHVLLIDCLPAEQGFSSVLFLCTETMVEAGGDAFIFPIIPYSADEPVIVTGRIKTEAFPRKGDCQSSVTVTDAYTGIAIHFSDYNIETARRVAQHIMVCIVNSLSKFRSFYDRQVKSNMVTDEIKVGLGYRKLTPAEYLSVFNTLLLEVKENSKLIKQIFEKMGGDEKA